MYIVRPITLADMTGIDTLISDDLLGITSLPKNKHFLHQKLRSSLAAFSNKIPTPLNEHYYFVLQDLQTGEIGGICGIESKTGRENPNYSYRLETTLAHLSDLPMPGKQQVLQFVVEREGPSRIGALYVLPSFRKEGLGRLLSLSRFLFMASFPERFDTTVVAEMRGHIDEHKKCLFWEGLGRHFLDLEFEDLMDLLEEFPDCIPLFTPQHPIYVCLLSKETQEMLGKVHENTLPALNLLTKEGFILTDEIDLFDAGPKIIAKTADIRTVRKSRLASVQSFSNTPLESEPYLISNQQLNFCTCYGPLKFIDADTVIVSSQVAQALQLKEGAQIRYIQEPSARSKEH